MTDQHLTDEELQEYALPEAEGFQTPPQILSASQVAHLNSCATCQQQVAAYRSVFAGLKEQEPATFGFDVASLVIEKLAQPTRRPAWILTLTILLSIAVLALPIAFLIRYGIVLKKLVTGLQPYTLPLITTAIITIIVFLAGDMFKQYRIKMIQLETI